MGSSSYLTNLEGEVVQHIEYVPFGEVFLEEKNSKWNTPYLFNSKELDKETGMYYYGARYYDPKISLWVSVDPLAVYNPVMESQFYYDGQHNGGMYNNKNLNVYGYCYQSPVIYEDPNGKQNYSVILGGLQRLVSNTAASALGSVHAVTAAHSVGLSDLFRMTEPPTTFSRSELISYHAGRAIADIAMMVEGGNIAGTGLGVSLTGAGAVAGVPTAIYGVGVGAEGAYDFAQSLSVLMSMGVNPEGESGSESSSSSESSSNAGSSSNVKKEQISKDLKETKEFGRQHGQKVYQKGNKYYSKDVDSHNGGAWKVFEKSGGKLKRIGTADENLNIFKE